MGFKVKNKADLHESIREICVIDFETTGLKVGYDRPTEVAVTVIEDNLITNKFQTLINPGMEISEELVKLTGITNEMVKDAPTPEEVMVELRRFIKNRVMMAHNASFDKRFLDAEMDIVGRKVDNPWLCTLLMSRRLILDSIDHKLPTLAQHLQIQATGAHRALADTITTSQLWVGHLQKMVIDLSGIERPDITVFQKMCKKKKDDIPKFLKALGEKYRKGNKGG